MRVIFFSLYRDFLHCTGPRGWPAENVKWNYRLAQPACPLSTETKLKIRQATMKSEEMIDSFLAVYPASGKFQVQLFPTSVRMFGKIQSGRFDSQVLLGDLHSHPDRYWLPNQFYRRIYQVLTVLGVCVISSFWVDSIPKRYSWIGLALLVPGVVHLLRSSETVEYFYFKFKSKPSESAFAIGRYGPDADRLDEFVALLIEQIKKVQSAELFDTDDPASPE